MARNIITRPCRVPMVNFLELASSDKAMYCPTCSSAENLQDLISLAIDVQILTS